MSFPGWIDQYIGIPYDELNCWHLIRRIYEDQWQITLPPFEIGPRGLAQAELWVVAWIEINRAGAQAGDLLAMTRARWVCHAGLIVSPGWMLHTLPGIESALERYDGFTYRQRIAGIYRHPRLG